VGARAPVHRRHGTLFSRAYQATRVLWVERVIPLLSLPAAGTGHASPMKCSGVCGFLAIGASRHLRHRTVHIGGPRRVYGGADATGAVIQKLEIIGDTNHNRSTGLTRRAEIR
jgi:hypothetical protein